MTTAPRTPGPTPAAPAVVTGVQLMKGIGARPARGFWAEAWATVFKRRAAVLALAWLALVTFFAVFAPVLASGHPVWMTWTDAAGARRSASPLWSNLQPLDLVLLAGAAMGGPWVLLAPRGARAGRAWSVLGGLAAAIAVLAVTKVVRGRLDAWAVEEARAALRTAEALAAHAPPLVRRPWGGYAIGGAVGGLVFALAAWAGGLRGSGARLAVLGAACAVAVAAVGARWNPPLQRFDYAERESAGEVRAAYTLVPWSPNQRASDLQRRPPMTDFAAARSLAETDPARGRSFLLGTDAFGADVLTQMLHACRLSISIGVVSTGIALVIGVTVGALMGYFGGWVDLLLFRVVEIFMAVPVLFLLIVSVAVLPDEFKTTYVIMAIIGCFTWTGMARFTRAEFMRLRHQDFVQAAEAAGMPLRSVLFRHMLPNGVAPVLVDASFAVAAAIAIEAVLSYLGLGPVDSPSWGKLLSYAISQEGEFKWWLAVFPGLAIFLTILSYNLLGEALRDAIDPKLKKARV